jgi:hypothetical protein
VAGGDAMASVAAGFKIGVHDFPGDCLLHVDL